MMYSTSLVKGKVNYVGVNDRNKSLFEGMWPLPLGISYNSYLINDEKIALIDTVDAVFFDVFIQKIKNIIGDKKISYLVINHMEPDHSGSINFIKALYPDITIVGNRQTFGMIDGYYGPVENKIVVKEGDEIDLGYHKLKFYLTPMVHWPETMMTLDQTEHILFSGDAFGCYGALNGGNIDSKINIDIYWDEMVRYYSNIVGKYGSSVQRALKKFTDVPVKTICSTHGPIWQENVAKVVGIYDKLSTYTGDTGVTIAFGSMYGHTEQMAEIIAEELSAQGIKNVVIHKLGKSHPSYIISDIFKYKGLILGAPTYSNQVYPEMEALLSKIQLREIKNRYVGCFGSYSWAGTAAKKIFSFAEKNNFDIVGDAVEMKQAMTAEVAEKCIALAKSMADKLKSE